MDLLACLQAFASVAEHGSLTRSAAALGVATSMLSRQIATLERQAQARLFHRTGRGVVPTEAGLRLLPRAKALLAESDLLVSDLRGELTVPAGTVDVAVVPAVRPLIAQLCARLRREHPRIRLRAHEGYSGQVEEWVTHGRVDVGLFNRYSRGSVRDAEPLLRSPMVLLGRKGLPVVRAPEVPFRRLQDVPLAVPMRPNGLVDWLASHALRRGLRIEFALEGGSESILVEAVTHAGLLMLMPEHVAQRSYGTARFAWSRVCEPGVTQVTWMALTRDRPVTPAGRLVAGLLRELAPSLARGRLHED